MIGRGLMRSGVYGIKSEILSRNEDCVAFLIPLTLRDFARGLKELSAREIPHAAEVRRVSG
jgi:hypothetical protein